MKQITLRKFTLTMTMFLATFFSGCNTEEVEFQIPEISVSPTTITAPDNKVGDVTIDVTTNRSWMVTIPEGIDWIVASPASGSGNGQITLTMLANDAAPREVDIKIATTTIYATVKLTQPGAYVLTEMFDMTFGTSGTGSGASGSAMNTYTDWGKSGISSSTAKFSGDGTILSSLVSNGYPGASGGSNAYLGSANKYFKISDLNINTGVATDYILSFGSCIYAPPFENSILNVETSIDGGTTWTTLACTRSFVDKQWGISTSAPFAIAADVKTLSIRFTATDGSQPRLDDIKLVAKGDLTVTQFPSVTTSQYLPSEITTTTAKVGGTYTYTATTPAIDELGVAYKITSSKDEFTIAPALSNVVTPFSVSLTGLGSTTTYSYKAYAKIGTTYYFGDEMTFKTMSEYTPPTPVNIYSDDFNTITAANVAYTGTNWLFYSTNASIDNSWKTGTYNNTSGIVDKYIQIVADKSLATPVTAYAMIPPINVATATSKTLIYNYAYYFPTTSGGLFNGSKLEVVASTDFAGNFTTATWTVIDDATKTAGDPTNVWGLRTVDLATVNSAAYASSTQLFIAFRYIGKGDTYRIDDVFFGQSAAPIIWGTPMLSKNAIFSDGVAVTAGTKILIPYKFGTGSPNVTVAVSGIGAGTVAVAGGTQTLTNDALEHLIELPITGTPTIGNITFTISGIPALTVNTIDAVATSETLILSTLLSGLTLPSPPTSLFTFANGITLSRIAAGTDVAPVFSYTSSSSSLWCGEWNKSGAAWVITIPIADELSGDVKVETSVFGVGASPKVWLAQYSIDNTTWLNGATPQNTYSINATATPGDNIALKFAIPISGKVAAGGKLYIKLYPDPNSTVSINGLTIGTSSVNSRIANSIVLKKVN